MRITIHIAKPFFKEVEQKITKRTVPRIVGPKEGENTKTIDTVITIKKPEKSKCIVNTLTFKDVHPNNVENTINYVRNKYGIKLKDKKEMAYVHPHTTKNLPKLSHTLKNHCEKMKKQALEYESKN